MEKRPIPENVLEMAKKCIDAGNEYITAMYNILLERAKSSILPTDETSPSVLMEIIANINKIVSAADSDRALIWRALIFQSGAINIVTKVDAGSKHLQAKALLERWVKLLGEMNRLSKEIAEVNVEPLNDSICEN